MHCSVFVPQLALCGPFEILKRWSVNLIHTPPNPITHDMEISDAGA